MPDYPNNSEGNTLEIKEKTHTIYIFSIQTSLGYVIQIITTIDLRPTGEAWKNGIGSVFIALINQISLLTDDGTGTDKAHVAFEDVDELWEFVNRALTKEALECSHLRAVMWAIASRKCIVCAYREGAKLPDAEWTAVQAGTLLEEKYRTPIIDLDKKSDEQERDE